MNALSYITGTRSTAGRETARTGDQALQVIGYRRSPERVYFLEHYQNPDEAPSLYMMNLTGRYPGRAVLCRDPANQNRGAATNSIAGGLESLLELGSSLRPLKLASPASFEMSARVVRRSALVLSRESVPVRKFTVKVGIRSLDQLSPTRHHYISTYLRPNVSLERIYQIPNRALAIAIVSYIGLPYEIGERVERALLLETV